MRGGAPPNMKMDCRSVELLVTISFDGRPPVSLGTDAVDLLTISSFLLAKSWGPLLCAC